MTVTNRTKLMVKRIRGFYFPDKSCSFESIILKTKKLTESFEIKLPQFEGPFDLLLFFIERDELDIHNIPIAKISNDFLDYLHHMQVMNIELASEFILVAATLMRIKAKLLLPRYSKDEEGNEIDPRQDLVRQLLDYKQFKAASEDLRVMEEIREQKIIRGNIQLELARIMTEAEGSNNLGELTQLTLYRLLTTFEKVMDRFKNQAADHTHKVFQYPYTIEQQKEHIGELLLSRPRLNFEDLFEACQNRLHGIFIFLALLEMIQVATVIIYTGTGLNNFWITKPETPAFYAN